MNALTAYQHGGTGAGIRVGVIDSGIDLQSAEFGDCSGGVGTGTCRITAASRDTAGNGTLDDVGGHGTAVAFTIAGRRNDAGTHGVAFDAQLIVARADSPGTCADTSEDGGCSFGDEPQCTFPALAARAEVCVRANRLDEDLYAGDLAPI